MNNQPIDIVDYGTGNSVEALLHLELQPRELAEVEITWGPIRRASIERLFRSGYPRDQLPQHWHWDWSAKQAKLSMLAGRCLGIECEGQMQGLIMVLTAGHFAHLDPDKGKDLLYIDYLEIAPWNVQPLALEPRFKAIGPRLFEAAVRLSRQEGFHGRVGLHSLSQAEPFYRGACKMTDLGPDAMVQDLHYFEFTRAQAEAYLAGRKSHA